MNYTINLTENETKEFLKDYVSSIVGKKPTKITFDVCESEDFAGRHTGGYIIRKTIIEFKADE